MRFYLLDRITTLEPPTRARAVKCVSLAEDVFVDHFPGHPVMPGTLVLEALAQLGGVLIEASARQAPSAQDQHAFLTMIDRAKLRRAVFPGDRLLLEAHVLRLTEDAGQVRGLAYLDRVDGQDNAIETSVRGPSDADRSPLVAEAELTFGLAHVTQPKSTERRREALHIWLHGRADPP